MEGEADDKTTCSYKMIYKYLYLNIFAGLHMYVCTAHTYIHAYVRKVQKDEHKILMVIDKCLDFREFTCSFIPL